MTVDTKDFPGMRILILAAATVAWALLITVAPNSSHCLGMNATSGSPQNFLWMIVVMNQPSQFAAGWLLMLAAMMAPVLTPPILHICRRSFANRRPLLIVMFLVGYVAVWMFVGIMLMMLAAVLNALVSVPCVAIAAVFFFALSWQCSPFKQRCLNRCHNHRALAAFGARAYCDVLHFGLDHGLWCAGSCWLWMLFPLLLPHAHLLAMLAVTLLVICERIEQPCPPRWRMRGLSRAVKVGTVQGAMLLRLRSANRSNSGWLSQPAS